MLKTIRKVGFNKSGSGSVSGKLILPSAWLKELQITKEDNEVELEIEEDKIIIKKFKKDSRQ